MSIAGNERRPSAFVEAAAICAMILAFGLLCGLLPIWRSGASFTVLSENASAFYDSTRQLRVHRGILLGVAVAALILFRAKGRLGRLDSLLGRQGVVGRIAGTIAAGAPFAIILLTFRDLPNAKSPLIVLGLVTGLVWIGSRFADRVELSVAIGVILIVCTAVMMVPGFATIPDLSSSYPVSADEAEIHYSIVVSQGDRLSQGERLFTNVMPHYGFLTPFALAIVERARGLLDFGAHIRFVQIMQVVFALSAFLCYWIWSRRKILAATFAFLPILGYVHTSHMSVFCPNQAGLRFVGLPLGLLLLIAARPSTKRDVPLLGCALGLLLLFNPETGVAIGAAYFTYLLSGRCRVPISRRELLRALVSFGLCISIAPVAFIFIYRASFEYFPFPEMHGPSYALTRFAGGYGGLKIYFGIGWIVILCHSVFEVSRSLLSIDRLDTRRRIRLSIAVAILVWFVYFANRPHPWNLWTYWFLYGFFIVDFLRQGRLTRFRRALGKGRVPMPLALVVVYTAMGIFLVISGLRDNLRIVRARPPVSSQVLSGVRLTASYAALAGRRARYVEAMAKETSLLYFTSNTYLVPLLSGVVCDLPFSDPYVEAFTVDDFDRSVLAIEAKRAGTLLFDDPGSGPTGSRERNIFIDRLKTRLSSSYRRDESASGWEVWKRKESSDHVL